MIGEPPSTAMPGNIASALVAQAKHQPDNTAIHFPTGVRHGRVQYGSASYRELGRSSAAYAHGLRAIGLEKGARVALMVPPGLPFFALFFALFRAGLVPVLVDPGIGLKPLKKCLDEAAPEAFIGVTRAQLARLVLRWGRGTIKHCITVGPRPGWQGWSLKALHRLGIDGDPDWVEDTSGEDMAAILFTSGSTGIPKGVVYRHRHFIRQVEMLREAFSMEPGEVDLATFPPFALFDPALGMTTIVPHMDPTRPGSANPEFLAQAIEQFGATNMFGSPALLRVLGRYAEASDTTFPTLRRVISAGAAVPADTIAMMQGALREPARVHTPYGATECLPVSTASSLDLDESIQARSQQGAGICVGRPVPPNEIAIIPISDSAIAQFDPAVTLSAGATGEIAVHGPTTTDRYWQREEQTRQAKMTDSEGRSWHRMGDVGYLDAQGRLWFCGRKAQRVDTGTVTLFPDQVEAVFNVHDAVERSALVGVGQPGEALPVLCVERAPGTKQDRDAIRHDLLAMAAQHAGIDQIRNVLFHPGFPVDIRHNAKIGREALARWAAGQLS